MLKTMLFIKGEIQPRLKQVEEVNRFLQLAFLWVEKTEDTENLQKLGSFTSYLRNKS